MNGPDLGAVRPTDLEASATAAGEPDAFGTEPPAATPLPFEHPLGTRPGTLPSTPAPRGSPMYGTPHHVIAPTTTTPRSAQDATEVANPPPPPRKNAASERTAIVTPLPSPIPEDAAPVERARRAASPPAIVMRTVVAQRASRRWQWIAGGLGVLVLLGAVAMLAPPWADEVAEPAAVVPEPVRAPPVPAVAPPAVAAPPSSPITVPAAPAPAAPAAAPVVEQPADPPVVEQPAAKVKPEKRRHRSRSRKATKKVKPRDDDDDSGRLTLPF